MRNKNNHSAEPAIQSSRRQILGFTTKGSALLAAKTWVAPSILAVTLPLHAQASPVTTNGPSTTLPLSCPGPESSSGNIPLTQLVIENETIQLGQYNLPAGTTLSKAILEYTVAVESNFLVENTGPGAGVLGLNVSAMITIVAPDGSTLTSFNATGLLAGNNLDTFDGAIDFGGASGLTVNGVQATENLTNSIDLINDAGLDPNLFIGSGNISFSVSASGQSVTTGLSNLASSISTFASMDMTISYDCEL